MSWYDDEIDRQARTADPADIRQFWLLLAEVQADVYALIEYLQEERLFDAVRVEEFRQEFRRDVVRRIKAMKHGAELLRTMIDQDARWGEHLPEPDGGK